MPKIKCEKKINITNRTIGKYIFLKNILLLKVLNMPVDASNFVAKEIWFPNKIKMQIIWDRARPNQNWPGLSENNGRIKTNKKVATEDIALPDIELSNNKLKSAFKNSLIILFIKGSKWQILQI